MTTVTLLLHGTSHPNDIDLSATDESTAEVPILQPLTFFGNTYNSIWVGIYKHRHYMMTLKGKFVRNDKELIQLEPYSHLQYENWNLLDIQMTERNRFFK